MKSSGREIKDLATTKMESEDNLQFSVQQADEGIRNVVNLRGSSAGKKGLMTKKREDLHEKNSRIEPCRNSKDASHFLGYQSSDTNASSHLDLMDVALGFENSSKYFSPENPQVHVIGNQISVPPSEAPVILEPSAVILAETGMQHYATYALPENTANADRQNIFSDTSSKHVCESDHSYAKIEIHTCPKCGVSYGMESALLAHLESHSKPSVYQCPYCKKKFRDEGKFAWHVNDHTDQRPLVCCKCNKSFEDKDTLKIHEALHSSETPHVCMICDSAFAEDGDLQQHLRTHNKVNPRPKELICRICGKKYSRINHFTRHMERHEKQPTNRSM